MGQRISMENNKKLDCMPSHHPRDDKTPQQVVDEFLKVCGGKKPKLLFRNKLQVKYGQSDMEFYDCFYPNDYTEETEVVVFIHGGYWAEGDTSLYHYLTESITSSGKIAVYLETQNAPEATISSIVSQCYCGLAKITNDFGKTSKLHISGHSSGGHKVMMLLTRDWSKYDETVCGFLEEKLFNVTVLCGVFDLEHLVDTEVNFPLKMSLKEARENSPICYTRQLSEATRMFKNMNLFLVQTEFDAITIKLWNKRFIEEIKKERMNRTYEICVKNHDHFSLMAELQNRSFLVTKVMCGTQKEELNEDNNCVLTEIL